MASVIAKCQDNECILTFLRERQRELCGEWDGALSRAFRLSILTIAEQTEPVRTLYEASKLRHIGPSMQRQLRPFFANRPPVQARAERPRESRNIPEASGSGPPQARGAGHEFQLPSFAAPPTGASLKKFVGYVPKKGGGAYGMMVALLIDKLKGREGLVKDDLISVAEKCGLVESTMRPHKTQSGRPYLNRSANRTFFCGWTSMETLRKHNLVLVNSDTGRYTLTPEGHAVALECVKRGRILLPSPEELQKEAAAAAAEAQQGGESGAQVQVAEQEQEQEQQQQQQPEEEEEELFPFGMAAIDPTATPVSIVDRSTFDTLRLPPLRPGEKFEQAYDVILLIDSREGGGPESPCSGNGLKESLEAAHHLIAEVRSLPVGDALWIARHRATREDFVLDFILERKRADDLWASIKSKRFKDQKLRLQRCGLRKLLYLVEGDLGAMNGSDAARTAALQTEIEDGFDVQRTRGIVDTMQRYSDLTQAITLRYNQAWNAFAVASATGANAAMFGGQERCMTYAEFLHVCRHINADTVGDLFGHMLLQIRNVSVDIAMAIMQRYPTLRSLAEAYRVLEGDHEAQARMLMSIPVKNNKTISESVSRKIFEFIWT